VGGGAGAEPPHGRCAEKGYAARVLGYRHLARSTLEAWINKVREMLETNNSSALEFMDEFRQNLFVKRCICTHLKTSSSSCPMGDGAGFRLQGYTQIGFTVPQGEIGQASAPKLPARNGDQVEVLTT
jgi:GTP pyrophosphokinase